MTIPPYQRPVSLVLEAMVNPTEDPERVRRSVLNLLGPVSVSEELEEDRIRTKAEGDSCLHRIYSQLRHRQTLTAARRLLLENAAEGETWIYFNKQAAYSGSAVVCDSAEESPLGPIKATIRSDKILSLIDWLTPHV